MQYTDYLEHYGILGMKWGIRRYQNADGTLTAAGKKRYKGDTPEQIERSERRKEKVVKAAKIGARVAASVAVSAVLGSIANNLISDITSQSSYSLGAREVQKMIQDGTLKGRDVASLSKQEILRWRAKQQQQYVVSELVGTERRAVSVPTRRTR